MKAGTWLADVHRLAYRLPALGVSADLAALTIAELWGLYALLRRFADAG